MPSEVSENPASDTSRVYRITEVVGTSPLGVDAAIEAAVSRAGESLHGLDWFEVADIRGHIQSGRIAHYQVTVKLGFRLDKAVSP